MGFLTIFVQALPSWPLNGDFLGAPKRETLLFQKCFHGLFKTLGTNNQQDHRVCGDNRNQLPAVRGDDTDERFN